MVLLAGCWVLVGGCKDEGGGIEKAQKKLRKALAPLAALSSPRRGWGKITLKVFVVRPAEKARWRKQTGRKWSPIALGSRLAQSDDSGKQVELGGGRVEVWAVAWDPTGQAEGMGVALVWFKDGRSYCLPQPRVMARYPGIKGVAAWAGVWMEAGWGARVLAGLGLGGLGKGEGRCYGRFRVELRPLKGIRTRKDGRVMAIAGQRLLASKGLEIKP